jgi:hypothetical protein
MELFTMVASPSPVRPLLILPAQDDLPTLLPLRASLANERASSAPTFDR